jgi:hypothetical protein
MKPQPSQARTPITFDDLALAALLIYNGWPLNTEPPEWPDGFVTFLVDRTPETERLAQDYATSALRVEPRRFYDALGIAKRLVHRTKRGG